jgi:hypothetical protein
MATCPGALNHVDGTVAGCTEDDRVDARGLQLLRRALNSDQGLAEERCKPGPFLMGDAAIASAAD